MLLAVKLLGLEDGGHIRVLSAHAAQPITIAHFASSSQLVFHLVNSTEQLSPLPPFSRQKPNSQPRLSPIPRRTSSSADPSDPRRRLDFFFTMASKLTPFLFRSCARTASRIARPQTRAFSVTACRPSDTLSVVCSPSCGVQGGCFIDSIAAGRWACVLYCVQLGRPAS